MVRTFIKQNYLIFFFYLSFILFLTCRNLDTHQVTAVLQYWEVNRTVFNFVLYLQSKWGPSEKFSVYLLRDWDSLMKKYILVSASYIMAKYEAFIKNLKMVGSDLTAPIFLPSPWSWPKAVWQDQWLKVRFTTKRGSLLPYHTVVN